MEKNEIQVLNEVQEIKSVDILPTNLEIEIRKAKQQRAALEKLFSELLVQGTDFDRVPGTDKPTLLKSGAELLCQIFHLAPGKVDIIQATEDFETGTFSYMVGVPVIHRETGILITYGIGAANSKEPKYRYRNVGEEGEKVKIENPDPAGQQNTLIKMAAKRAFIDAVLKATGASRMFTQDMEDFMVPEKASSKQVGYIKHLLNGTSNDEMLQKMSEILGREVTWDDLTREEATKVIDDLKQSKNQSTQTAAAQNKKTKQETAKFKCEDCGTDITDTVAKYSKENFGRHLCMKCQKKQPDPFDIPPEEPSF